MTPEKAMAEAETIPGRKEKRYPANAQVQMEESALLLKDVSLSGGCIQSDDFMEVIPNGNYTIMIIPEEESQLETFTVDIVSRWVRMKRTGSESGFIMIIPPGNMIVEHYIEYLKSKSQDSAGDDTID